MANSQINIENGDTLHALFRKRVASSPDAPAYRQFDRPSNAWTVCTWRDCAATVKQYRQAMLNEGLGVGDRVAMMLNNCIEWVIFDQAALSLGLITVPLFSEDNAGNCAHILRDAGVRLLLAGNQRQLKKILAQIDTLKSLNRIICCEPSTASGDNGVICLSDWLAAASLNGNNAAAVAAQDFEPSAEALATLVYTSGTTGQPKGVMLTHKNIVSNIHCVSQVFDFGPDDLFLSFLPLSHIFERVAGYYLTMVFGCCVAYARSIATLREDLRFHRPAVLLAVPRIYESVHTKLQQKFSSPPMRLLLRLCVALGDLHYRHMRAGTQRYWLKPLWRLCDRMVAAKVRMIFGGRMRCSFVGGAPMSAEVAKFFIACGIPVYQGYGLTEAAPVVAANRPDDNLPASIGLPIPGVEVRIGVQDELLTRSDCVMQGYWNLPEASAQAIDTQGWLHTGDMARMDAAGRLFITGRIKEIIVMSTGEKVPPADIEMAITSAGLAAQVMVYGEGRPFLIALVVPNEEITRDKDARALSAALKNSIARVLKKFPAYARIRRVLIVRTPWTVENGMLTPTLKTRRMQVTAAYCNEIAASYRGF